MKHGIRDWARNAYLLHLDPRFRPTPTATEVMWAAYRRALILASAWAGLLFIQFGPEAKPLVGAIAIGMTLVAAHFGTALGTVWLVLRQRAPRDDLSDEEVRSFIQSVRTVS